MATLWLVVAAALTPALARAQSTSIAYDKWLAKAPEKTTLRIGRDSAGELLVWRVSDPLSAYNGLTLVWMELTDDDVLLTVDPRPGWDSMTKASLGTDAGNVIAVISGGMWSGAYDVKQSRARTPNGLVYANGQSVAQLAAKSDAGGVLVSCDEQEVRVIPTATFRTQTKSTPLPCDQHELRTASALQTNVILGGPHTARIAKSAPSNRVAAGSMGKKIVVAGAFTASGFALPLDEFSRYIDAQAARRGLSGLTMLNLEGACGAQIYLPQLEKRFGCSKPGYLVNRIVLRHTDG